MIKSIEGLTKMDIKIYEGVDLSKYTTYKVGGKCLGIVYPKDINELIRLLKYLRSNSFKYKILGNGSNLLFILIYYLVVNIMMEY